MMNSTFILRLSAITVLSIFALPAAQRHVTFAEDGAQRLVRADPRGRFFDIASRINGGIFDVQAEPVLGGSTRSTQAIFNLPSLSLKGKATYQDDGGDNLVALWSFESDAAAGTIALEDTPYFSNYALQLRRPTVSSEADLDSLLGSLLNWDGPLRLSTMNMQHEQIAGSLRVSYCSLRSSFEPKDLILLVAAMQSDGWYATLEIGKGMVSRFYPNKEFIPERFPPLEQIITGWPDARLWDGIRNPRKGWPTNAHALRDRVLITELARRGLTTPQIIDLLRIDAPYGYADRAVVTDGTLEALRPGWVELYFKDALEMYETEHAKDAAIVVAGMAATHCSPKTEAAAIEMVDARYAGPAAVRYLIECSNSAKALSAVKGRIAAGEQLDLTGLPDMEKRVAHGK